MKAFKFEARKHGALGVATLFVEIEAETYDDALKVFDETRGATHEYTDCPNLVWADLHPEDDICTKEGCTYPANDNIVYCQQHKNERST